MRRAGAVQVVPLGILHGFFWGCFGFEGRKEGRYTCAAGFLADFAILQPGHHSCLSGCLFEDSEWTIALTFENFWQGKVSKIKGDFVYVAFSSVGGAKPPQVVELDRLRPAGGHAPARLERRHFPLSAQVEILKSEK
jgi:hypothetical protein